MLQQVYAHFIIGKLFEKSSFRSTNKAYWLISSYQTHEEKKNRFITFFAQDFIKKKKKKKKPDLSIKNPDFSQKIKCFFSFVHYICHGTYFAR